MRKVRRAFTLVELLVVIGLIMVLAAIAVLFVPAISDQARAARGAAQLQGWLFQAKQRALRDRTPVGIRLIPSANPLGDPTQFIWAKDAHFIWQPDDYSGGTLSTALDGATTVDILGVDLWNGDDGTDPTTWDVQIGDYLEIGDGGLLRRIVGVTKSSVQVITPVLYKIEPTVNYRIIRGGRIIGDEPLTMTAQVVVDLKTNADYGNPLPVGPAGVIDVLFSPSGQVISPGVVTDKIILWVRDVSDALNTNPIDGQPALIVVYVNSGLVASYPVSQTGSPYLFVK